MSKFTTMGRLATTALAAAFTFGQVSDASASTLREIFLSDGLPADVIASDQFAHSLVNNVGDPNVIDVGDVLQGGLVMERAKAGDNAFVGLDHDAGNSEWGGVFRIKVLEKNSVGGGESQFVFGPDESFESQWGEGTMVVMWEDKVGEGNDFDLHDTQLQPGETAGADAVDALASISDGSFYWTLGLAEAGNAWIAEASDTLTDGMDPGTLFGEMTFALSRTQETFDQNGLGAEWAMVTRSNTAGSGEFIGDADMGGGLDGSPWDITGEADVAFTIVPTPSAAISGLVLLGGMVARRRI